MEIEIKGMEDRGWMEEEPQQTSVVAGGDRYKWPCACERSLFSRCRPGVKVLNNWTIRSLEDAEMKLCEISLPLA
jgi:hypothetical protein